MHQEARVDRSWSPVWVWAGIALGALALLAAAYYVREALAPFVVALALAYLISPLVDRLEARGVSRPAGVALLTLLVLLSVALVLVLVVPVIHRELSSFFYRVPTYFRQFQEVAVPLIAKWTGIDLTGEFSTIAQRVRDLVPNIPQYLLLIVGRIFSSTYSILISALSLVIIPVFAFYLLVDFPKMKATLFEYVPPAYREDVTCWTGRIDHVLSSFIRGQLLDAGIMGVLNSIGLMIVGVDFAILIGMLSGLANIIPYMSIIVGVIPAALLAGLEYRDLVHPALALGVFVVTQTLDGFVLQPWIVGESVALHPVVVMIAVLIGGQVGGLAGMLLAVPGAAILQLVFLALLERYKCSRLFLTGEVGPDAPHIIVD